MSAGKGSKSRPLSVTDTEYSSSWEKTFGKKEEKKDIPTDVATTLVETKPTLPESWIGQMRQVEYIAYGSDHMPVMKLKLQQWLPTATGFCGWVDVPVVKLGEPL